MSWVKDESGTGRWYASGAADEDTRHLLVRVGEQMRELHGTTVHVYELGEAGLFPLEPLAGCRFVATYSPAPWGSREYGEIIAMDDAAAYAYLEREGYLP